MIADGGCTRRPQDQHGFPLPHPELAKEQAREAAAAAAAAAQRGAAEPSEFDVSMLGMSPDSGLPRFTARVGDGAWARTWVPDACGNTAPGGEGGGGAPMQAPRGGLAGPVLGMPGGPASGMAPAVQQLQQQMLMQQQQAGLPPGMPPRRSPAMASASTTSTTTRFAPVTPPTAMFPPPVSASAAAAPPHADVPPRI
jgi:hypothetical protein